MGWGGHEGRDTSRKEVQGIHCIILGLRNSQEKKKKNLYIYVYILESFLGVFWYGSMAG